jgi:hypothetical protein
MVETPGGGSQAKSEEQPHSARTALRSDLPGIIQDQQPTLTSRIVLR